MDVPDDFVIKTCEDCGFEHAPIRSCKSIKEWNEFSEYLKDLQEGS